MTIKSLAIAALAVGLSASPAAAVSMNGSFGAAMFGTTSNTASIGVGSTLGNSGTLLSDKTGDFGPAGLFTPLTLGSFVLANGNSISFTSSIGNYIGTFSNTQATGPASNRVASAYALGTFTPSGIFGSFDPGAASLTLSFTQNGENGAISGGFTLSTPPAPVPGIPEPAAWAMLIAGFGLTGAAMRRRSARTVAA